MIVENLVDQLNETADDLRDCKTVLVAMPTIKAQPPVLAAIENLAIATLEQSRWVLMKLAVRIVQAEQAEEVNDDN